MHLLVIGAASVRRAVSADWRLRTPWLVTGRLRSNDPPEPSSLGRATIQPTYVAADRCRVQHVEHQKPRPTSSARAAVVISQRDQVLVRALLLHAASTASHTEVMAHVDCDEFAYRLVRCQHPIHRVLAPNQQVLALVAVNVEHHLRGRSGRRSVE